VDAARGANEIERRGERLHLDRRFLAEATDAGDPSLVHGYAITGHVAQGLTVDHAFVLAGEGIDREWAYVALSRGRHANRLYLAARPDDDRAEFAPLARDAADPVDRLARQLQRSTAQVLAIDSGRPLKADASQPERRRRFRWLPGRRHEPHAVDQRRAYADAGHGGIPFETEAEFDQGAARSDAQCADRQAERLLQRERGIGRAL
jgi:hypothetical protein